MIATITAVNLLSKINRKVSTFFFYDFTESVEVVRYNMNLLPL